nr:hypothetical protein [uncultured Roseateles sp.]
MKLILSALAALVATAVTQAAELQASGAIRPDHETKWGAHRVGLDRLAESIAEAEKAIDADAPLSADAAGFQALGHQVETMALTLDHLSDQVAALVAEKG